MLCVGNVAPRRVFTLLTVSVRVLVPTRRRGQGHRAIVRFEMRRADGDAADGIIGNGLGGDGIHGLGEGHEQGGRIGRHNGMDAARDHAIGRDANLQSRHDSRRKSGTNAGPGPSRCSNR